MIADSAEHKKAKTALVRCLGVRRDAIGHVTICLSWGKFEKNETRDPNWSRKSGLLYLNSCLIHWFKSFVGLQPTAAGDSLEMSRIWAIWFGAVGENGCFSSIRHEN